MDVVLPKPGRYVVAVSGGVDSVALLDILQRQPELDLVVAHFDHGIRPDSAEDRRLVQSLAEKYELPFVCEEGKLGPAVSEATARTARYGFLQKITKNEGSQAIITAHHEDDFLETGILNMLRGTHRKGLSSLNSNKVVRPLLKVPKSDLIKYARAHQLQWRKDTTNEDTTYLRNYVRHRILSRFNEKDRAKLVNLFNNAAATNKQIDATLEKLLSKHVSTHSLDRKWFIQLPYATSKEVMAAWLRASGLRDFDRKAIERLVVGAKTSHPGKRIAAIKGYYMEVGKENLALRGPER